MEGIDAHYNRLLFRHERMIDAVDRKESARNRAAEEMATELVQGNPVQFGYFYAGGKRHVRTLDADDVIGEIDGEALRAAVMSKEPGKAEGVWREAALRLCARHADDYLEWMATR